MNEIRGIIEGRFKDFDEFSDLVNRVCSVVEKNEPGTLNYEFFVDRERARFLAYEVYADEAAFHAHNQTMASFMEEIQQTVEFERATTLGQVSDPQVKDALQQMGFHTMDSLVGVRSGG